MITVRWQAVAVALAAALWAAPAQALFGDDEARKAILELRARVTSLEETQRRQQTLSQEQAEQLTALRRVLAELANQNEALRAELARLRGANEQLARDVAEAQRRVADQLQGLDGRLKPLEPQKVVLDGREFQVTPDERGQFEAAMGLLRRGDFDEAAAALQSFLKRFAVSGYSDAVRFALGNAQYGQRQYREAIATLRTVLAQQPPHPRAAEAALALASCLIELKDVKAARKALEELQRSYPGTEAAQAAKERLAALK